jgi:hypothetical protein
VLGGQEILLFWAVLGGLLFIDNGVLLPPGGDCLRFGRVGRLRYDLGLRIEVLRRDLVLLNPFNPFDRVVATTRSIGPLNVAAFGRSARQVRDGQRGANALSWLGSGYLALLVLLGAASLVTPFGWVLAVLAVGHLMFWLASFAVLLRYRVGLCLSMGRVASLAVEAVLVPGYLVNLGKRVWFRRSFDLPAATLGLRQVLRIRDEPAQDLQRLRLGRRLDEIAQSLDLDPAAQQWFAEARQCLTTSVPPAGS